MHTRLLSILSIFTILLLIFILAQNIVRADSDSAVIHGKVSEIVETEVTFPILKRFWFRNYLTASGTTYEYKEGVRVYVILTDENNILSTKCVFTDENGEYSITIPKGSYYIQTDKGGYETATLWEIDVSTTDTYEADIAIFKGDSDDSKFFPLSIDENRDQIDEGIEDEKIAGEITVNSTKNEEYQKTFVIYSDLTFNPINITKGNLSFNVNGDDDIGGRTIVIDIEDDFFNLKNGTTIQYDGNKIDQSDNLSDVLNPNDDGSNPEYLIVNGENGVQMFVSIPHFSEHSISIFNTPVEDIIEPDIEPVVEEVVKKVKQNKELVAVLAIGILLIAAIVMLRKGKDD